MQNYTCTWTREARPSSRTPNDSGGSEPAGNGLHHRVVRSGVPHSRGDTLKETGASVWLPFLLWALLHFFIPGSCFRGWRKGAHGQREGAAQQKTREGRDTRSD